MRNNWCTLIPGVTLILLCNAEVVSGQTQDQMQSVSGDSSRARSREDSRQLVIESTLESSVTIKGVTLEQCHAHVALSYQQRNTIARADGELSRDNCARSDGTYEIIAYIRTDAGDSTTLRFEENWQGLAETPLKFRHDYPIGEQVSLTRLRVGQVHCTCLEQFADPAATQAPQ